MLTEFTPNIVRLLGKRTKLGDLPRPEETRSTINDVSLNGHERLNRKGKENYLGSDRELFVDEIVTDDKEESNEFNEGPNVVAPSPWSDDSDGLEYKASGCESSGKKYIDGAVRLSLIPPTPQYLLDLYNGKEKGPAFHRLIRLYNAIFAFTSTGGNIDHLINNGRVPYVYRLNGQNHHVFGSLIPNENETPKFYQLYIYDTINEVDNRLQWVSVQDRQSVDKEVVRGLITMLDEINQLVVIRSESGRECYISSIDEVVGIIVGDTEETCGDRDIVKMMEYEPGCIAPNCPDIISSVFRLKLDQLMGDIKDKKHFGVCIGEKLIYDIPIQGEVVGEVIIDKVNEDANWYLTKCTRCLNEVPFIVGKFKCQNSVAQIAQKSVEDLYSPDKEELREQQFPSYLKIFEKQKYNMTVLITEENVMNGSEVYEATGIGNGNESGGNFTLSSNQTIETNKMSAMNAVKNIMSKAKFDDLSSLKVGKFDWKIKNSRMHTFIPGNADDVLKDKFTVGKCYIIRKFIIQAYKPDDKFLCLTNDVQLVFSKDTQMKEIEESTCSIETNVFDFYDHSGLIELTKQTIQADVIGIVKFYQPLTHLVNRFNDAQKQVKLILTDRRFKLTIKASDNTGCIDIIVNDQQIRAILGKRDVHLLKQMGEDKSFPSKLKALVNRKYTIKLIIKEFNVVHKATTYLATNNCTAFIDPNQHLPDDKACMQQQIATTSSSNYCNVPSPSKRMHKIKTEIFKYSSLEDDTIQRGSKVY
ncbi:hypothetical protein AgCh_012992 [Apium graveolens]